MSISNAKVFYMHAKIGKIQNKKFKTFKNVWYLTMIISMYEFYKPHTYPHFAKIDMAPHIS